MYEKIIISDEQLLKLRDVARDAYPFESCALLAGSFTSTCECMIKLVIPLNNADRSSISFSIKPDDLIKAYELISAKGLELVGIFHSHPYSNAYPSSKDVRYMEINPVPWVILSGIDDDIRAFILTEGEKDNGEPPVYCDDNDGNNLNGSKYKVKEVRLVILS